MAALSSAEKNRHDQSAVYGEITSDQVPIYERRRKTTDRSDLRERQITRNVRTSTMPNDKVSEAVVSRPPTDKIFRDSYAKKGLQPSSLDDEKPAPPPYQQPQPVTRREQVEYAPAPVERTMSQVVRRKRRLNLKKPSAARLAEARLEIIPMNIAIGAAGGGTFALFQLPVAVASSVFFVMALAIDSFFKANVTEESGSFITTVENLALGTVKTLAEAFDKVSEFLFDFKASELPGYAFGATYMLLLAYGMILLASIYLAYTATSFKPLSGWRAGFKKGAFMIAVVGYSIPVVNLFPWFIVWIFAVGRYPK